MALAVSSLSQICREIKTVVNTALGVQVSISNPGDTSEATDTHRVNLFFHRFEPFSFDADVLPGENLFIRMHCLITPFAVLEDSIGAGENDLRLLGEVLRLFHENPVFRFTVEDDDFQVQMILQNFGLDQINQLWSTQGEIAYRPSLLYEAALAPVIPRIKAVGSPMAGGLGVRAQADMDREAEIPSASPPDVAPTVVDTDLENWAPAICFVRGSDCVQSLSLEVGSAELADFSPEVWVAGEEGASVTLRWDIWDAVSGWSTHPDETPAAAAGEVLHPALAAEADTTPVSLPFDDRAGQAVLYAVRSYTRGLDGAVVSVRSNPLLVTLYGGSP